MTTPRLVASGGREVELADLVPQLLGRPCSVRVQRIARLWGGYGSVSRITVTNTGSSDVPVQQLIAKQVDPPRGSGTSHERKLKSYAVEAAFYAHYAAATADRGGCELPKALLVDAAPITVTGSSGHFLFILSDLTRDFPVQPHGYSQQEARAALDWLARFHSAWWEDVPGQHWPVCHSQALHEPQVEPTAGDSCGGGSGTAAAAAACVPDRLWQQGCYWYLETRQEELAAVPQSWAALEHAAEELDRVLRGMRADGSRTRAHRTLLHGDAKSENFVFSHGSSAEGKPCRCAAYDYQYVGEGLGVRDVAYLMASSLEPGLAGDLEQSLLQHYHSSLCAALQRRGKGAAADAYPFEVCQAQFELCIADYARFLAGWGWWGDVDWLRRRAREVLDRLPATVAAATATW